MSAQNDEQAAFRAAHRAFKEKAFDRAVEGFRDLVVRDEKQPLYRYYLAEALRLRGRAGDVESVAEHFQVCRRLAPESDLRDQCQQGLESLRQGARDAAERKEKEADEHRQREEAARKAREEAERLDEQRRARAERLRTRERATQRFWNEIPGTYVNRISEENPKRNHGCNYRRDTILVISIGACENGSCPARIQFRYAYVRDSDDADICPESRHGSESSSIDLRLNLSVTRVTVSETEQRFSFAAADVRALTCDIRVEHNNRADEQNRRQVEDRRSRLCDLERWRPSIVRDGDELQIENAGFVSGAIRRGVAPPAIVAPPKTAAAPTRSMTRSECVQRWAAAVRAQGAARESFNSARRGDEGNCEANRRFTRILEQQLTLLKACKGHLGADWEGKVVIYEDSLKDIKDERCG